MLGARTAAWWASGRTGLGAALALASGCGADLGECDMAALAASTDAAESKPYAGQRLVHQSCASGQCHAASARGEARQGAPLGLDFDLVVADASLAERVKVALGAAKVDELAESMWALIDDGTMPPEGKRTPLAGEAKETVRNWLACGAPVISQPLAGVSDGARWDEIFPALEATCGACHGASSPNGAWLVAGDACATRAKLLGEPASGPLCGTDAAALIDTGDANASLLLQKLEAMPPCGTPMPPDRSAGTASPLAAPLRAWIEAGAEAADCGP